MNKITNFYIKTGLVLVISSASGFNMALHGTASDSSNSSSMIYLKVTDKRISVPLQSF